MPKKYRSSYWDKPSSSPDNDSYDSASDYDYPSERRSRPRRKSIGHEVLDRVSQGIGLNRSLSRTRTRSTAISNPPSPRQHRHRSVDDHYYRDEGGPVRHRYRRHDSYSESPRRGSSKRHRSPDSRTEDDLRWEHAARAAFDTAVVEALRVRKEPGSWAGGKGARVATAALGAAAVDALIDKDPKRHGARMTVESVIGGLLANRIVNGPRSELRR